MYRGVVKVLYRGADQVVALCYARGVLPRAASQSCMWVPPAATESFLSLSFRNCFLRDFLSINYVVVARAATCVARAVRTMIRVAMWTKCQVFVDSDVFVVDELTSV